MTATAIVRPLNSNCNTSNDALVRVSNQSCSSVTISSVSVSALDPDGGCGDLEGSLMYDIDATVESKTTETVEVGSIAWCCTCSTSFDCSWQLEAVLDTDQGDITSDLSKVFTKSFGKFCDKCSSSGSSTSSQVVIGDDVVGGICGAPGVPVL